MNGVPSARGEMRLISAPANSPDALRERIVDGEAHRDVTDQLGGSHRSDEQLIRLRRRSPSREADPRAYLTAPEKPSAGERARRRRPACEWRQSTPRSSSNSIRSAPIRRRWFWAAESLARRIAGGHRLPEPEIGRENADRAGKLATRENASSARVNPPRPSPADGTPFDRS